MAITASKLLIILGVIVCVVMLPFVIDITHEAVPSPTEPILGAGSGYTYSRTITIDATKVPSTQTNFPVLISGTYDYLATVANGGKVTDAQGDDIIFTSNLDCSTPLDWEIELYTATTGAVVYWVEVPSVDGTTDTVIYMCYGNSGVTTDQSDTTGTYDTAYKVVWHVGTPSALSGNDSTINNNDGTVTNGAATAGKIHGGMSVDGGDYINIADSSDWANDTTQSKVTISMWANVNPTDSNLRALWRHTEGDSAMYKQTDNEFEGYNGAFLATAITATQGQWYYVVWEQDEFGVADNVKIFVDGVSKYDSTGHKILGDGGIRLAADAFGQDFKGIVDEFRVSNNMRTVDWTLTEFNNQNSPSTFYAVGDEVSAAGASHTRRQSEFFWD